MSDPRQLSEDFRAALFAESTGEALGVLVTLKMTLADGSVVVERICDQPGGITSRGNDFAYHPMGIRLPSAQAGQSPKARLKIDYVDRRLGTRLRTAITSVATIELILASEPDNVEMSWTDKEVGGLKWNVTDMNIDLARPDGRREPYPVPSFTPEVAPGAH